MQYIMNSFKLFPIALFIELLFFFFFSVFRNVAVYVTNDGMWTASKIIHKTEDGKSLNELRFFII